MKGARLRELRKAQKMTQSELGERLGVVKQTVSNWEKDLFEPNTEALARIAQIFDVSVDYLIGTIQFEKAESSLTKEESTILHLYNTCVDKRGFLKVVSAFYNLNELGQDILIGKAAELSGTHPKAVAVALPLTGTGK